jgi:molybdate transport system substrate-binding protein
LNIGSSGTLARQIEQGNPADIFISASNDWAAYAEKYGMFSRKAILCKNSLVFIAPVNSTLDSLPLLPDFNPAVMFDGYLSMGDPEHVPAGRYARETLLALGWDSIFHNRILPAKDVRSALILVEMAECELGIVYYSDALHSTKIKIVAHIPDSLHSPIVFYALLSKNAPEPVVHFYDYLWSRDNIAIWEKFGLGGVY